MTIKEKYADLLKLGESLNVKNGEVYEKEGKLMVKGTTEYQMAKDILWDKVKTYPDYKTEPTSGSRRPVRPGSMRSRTRRR